MLPPVVVLTRRVGQFFGAGPGGAPTTPGANNPNTLRVPSLNWTTASAAEVQHVLPQLLQWAQAQQRNPRPAHVAMWYRGGWYYYAYWTGAGVAYYKSSPSKNYPGGPPNLPGAPAAPGGASTNPNDAAALR
jgi:hypothetical protein